MGEPGDVRIVVSWAFRSDAGSSGSSRVLPWQARIRAAGASHLGRARRPHPSASRRTTPCRRSDPALLGSCERFHCGGGEAVLEQRHGALSESLPRARVLGSVAPLGGRSDPNRDPLISLRARLRGAKPHPGTGLFASEKRRQCSRARPRYAPKNRKPRTVQIPWRLRLPEAACGVRPRVGGSPRCNLTERPRSNATAALF